MKKYCPRIPVGIPVGIAVIVCSLGCQSDDHPGPSAERRTDPRVVQVDIVTPQASDSQRTTTQPATVHAYYEARVYAKAAGYLTELRADLGKIVEQGDVLGVIGIPEMDKQRETKVVAIERLEAVQRRTAAQLDVSRAGASSYQAKVEQAKAEVAKTEANLKAAEVELNRITNLVQQRAVAERLQDEARERHDAAAAAMTAAVAAISSAAAEYELAQAENAAAQAGVEVAAAATKVARAELRELDELMKYATLTAPFDGVVTERNVELGDLVRNAQNSAAKDELPLFVITKLDKVRIRVAIPERDAPLADADDVATITFQAIPEKKFEGSVSRTAAVLDPQTRTMLVEIDLDNASGELRPGMFGQATITLSPPGDALSLPANAVRYDEQGNSYVYVVNSSNQVEVVTVQTGYDDGTQTEITTGLEADSRVIGPILQRLKSGQQVRVAES